MTIPDSFNTTHALVLRSHWHNPTTRRLEAVRACHQGDVETLVSLVNTYIDLRSRKGIATSDNTRAYYTIAIQDWCAFCWPNAALSPFVPLLHASEDDVAYYLTTLLQKGGHLAGSSQEPLSPGSAATYLAGVRALYRALVWAGAIDHSPAQAVPAPADPRPAHERRPALPLADYQALLAEINKTYKTHPAKLARTQLLVRLLGDEGLRVSEAVGLNVVDVDMQNRHLYIRRGKGGKARTVPLTPACYKSLEQWLMVRVGEAALDEPALLVNVGKKVKKERRGRAMHPNTVRLELSRFYKKLGFAERYRGAHMLRHTAGTRLYHHTKDLHVVSQILGHSDVNTSSIYAKMDTSTLHQAMQTLEKDDANNPTNTDVNNTDNTRSTTLDSAW